LQPLVYGASNELVGFRIYPGRQRQKFFCLGLQAGDLLQSIDNLMIKGLLPSPQEMEMLELRIVQSFASERRMALQIKRGPPNGEAVELNFLTSDNCGA
jgi:type II secretory pathway component PulC